MNLISVYAPQAGKSAEEKEEFLFLLQKVLSSIDDREGMILCGDLNCHVGAETDGYEDVHGENGYGLRNTEGEMMLEMAQAMNLIVINTWFTKSDKRKITYVSGGHKSVVDYVLVRKRDRAMVKDVSVVSGEACLPQHKLIICKVTIKQQVKQMRKTFVTKCKVWKLNDDRAKIQFSEKVHAKAMARCDADVESMWKELKNAYWKCLMKCVEGRRVCRGTERHGGGMRRLPEQSRRSDACIRFGTSQELKETGWRIVGLES